MNHEVLFTTTWTYDLLLKVANQSSGGALSFDQESKIMSGLVTHWIRDAYELATFSGDK